MSIWTIIPTPIAYTSLPAVDDDRATLPAYNSTNCQIICARIRQPVSKNSRSIQRFCVLDALLQQINALLAPCAPGDPFVSVILVPNSEGALLRHDICSNLRALVTVHALNEGPPSCRREPLRGAELLDVPSAFGHTVFACHAIGGIRFIDAVVVLSTVKDAGEEVGEGTNLPIYVKLMATLECPSLPMTWSNILSQRMASGHALITAKVTGTRTSWWKFLSSSC
jgi:hypothetical protein